MPATICATIPKRLFFISTPPILPPPPPSPTAKMPESAKPSWKDPYTLTAEEMSVFLPPVNRAMRTLDRNFFKKTIPLVAAHIFDPKNIGRFQKECAKDILRLPRTKTIVEKDAVGGVIKLLLLRPGVKIDGNIRRVEVRGDTWANNFHDRPIDSGGKDPRIHS